MARASTRFIPKVIGTALALALTAAPAVAHGKSTDQGDQPASKHHSKAKGAVVGGAGGALVGGKKGAAAGAAGGALYQHHKNKKEAKQQAKAQRQ